MGFKIGGIVISGPLVLGPMAGVTDLPFRLLCRECGADLIYTEMVSAKGIWYNNKNTEERVPSITAAVLTGILSAESRRRSAFR